MFRFVLPANAAGQAAYARHYASSRTAALAYQMLGAIDSKASALLRYDGIALAILALIVLSPGTAEDGRGAALVPAQIALTLFALSAFICQLVVWLRWLTPEEMAAMAEAEAQDDADGGSASPGGAAAAAPPAAAEAFRMVNLRTNGYRLAWLLSFAATFPLILVLFQLLSASG